MQTFVEWTPQNQNTAVPIPPNQTSTGLQATNTDYYYCYSFNYFTALINRAFRDGMADLITATGGGASPIASARQPVLTWDVDSFKAVLNAEEDYYKESLASKIRIFMNPPLFALFNSFPSYNNGLTGVADGKNYQLLVEDYLGINLIEFPSAGSGTTWTAIQMFQELSTIDTWTPVSSIVFTSNTIPIVPNQLSSPLIYNEGQVVTGLGNNSNFAMIVTDFETNQQVYKPQILYSPTAEYRRIDMTGNTPLTNIDLEVFWRDKLGNLNQFKLPSGASATIKFLFERKDKLGVKELAEEM